MNRVAQLRANELSDRPYNPVEDRKALLRVQNMSLLCHCSAELDEATLMYFGVNDLFLGDGNYFLILCSETSSSLFADEEPAHRPLPMVPPVGVGIPTPTEDEGPPPAMDVSGRSFVYRLVDEIVVECLHGHYTFYTAEIDGRLVILVCFLYGLHEQLEHGLTHMISEHCRQISQTCRERYDLQVVCYLSEKIHSIRHIAQAYHSLLNLVTLHRFVDLDFETKIGSQRTMIVRRPQPTVPAAKGNAIEEAAQQLANALLTNDSIHASLDRIFEEMIDDTTSVNELKNRYGDLFESLCVQLHLRGVRINEAALRQEQFEIIHSATHWEKPKQWFHQLLDYILTRTQRHKDDTLLRRMESALEYIREHLTEPDLSVERVAASLAITPVALSVIFRMQIHTTPSQYIRKARLQKAVELLSGTDLTVRQVSEQCGFGSVETFHRVFKEEHGITPAKLKAISGSFADADEHE